MNETSPDPALPSGIPARTFIGKFEVVCVLGRGGMGEVVKAIEPMAKQAVAIKLLDAEAYADEDLLRRFEREGQAAQFLEHQNIARFYGMEYDDEARPIIVMEFVDGVPMDQLIRENLEMQFSSITDYCVQAAKGLEYAFRRSIIHRDIKPSNLIVMPTGMLKIIDFGLAKSLWDNTHLTGTGMVVGTPRYISPEQGMGRNVDHRSDIYSLGATLYELLTRQVPFDGETPMAIMMKHINSPLIPPYMINPKVPSDLNEIVIRMMAKDPKDRYQDYEPLIRDLESAKIHRLAKERRMPGDANVAGQSMAPITGSDPTFISDKDYSYSNTGRPSSYLTEGLVDVKYTGPEEAPVSRLKLVFLGLAGLLIIGMSLFLLSMPTTTIDGERKPSRLGKAISGMLAKPPANKTGGTPAEQAKDDEEKITATRERMESLLSKVLTHREKSSKLEVPTVRELRRADVIGAEDAVDAWGTDFYIVNSGGGGGTLVSAGRDRAENTADDFRLSLDGSTRQIPKPRTAEDFTVGIKSN
jgi:serine/threonine protein kinase